MSTAIPNSEDISNAEPLPSSPDSTLTTTYDPNTSTGVDDDDDYYEPSRFGNNPIMKFYESHIAPNLGISLFLLSQFFNSLMLLFCKILITPSEAHPDKTPMHPFQIMFMRMVITYLGCIYYFWKVSPNPDFPFGPKGYRKFMMLRGFGGYVGICGQYLSLMYLDISDTITITFLSPTVTSIFAWFFLSQLLTKVELGFGGLAFMGVVLISQPEFLFGARAGAEDDGSGLSHFIGCLFALGSTLGSATAMCSIKKIGFNAHPLLTVSMYALISCFLSLGLGVLTLDNFWQMPTSLRDWTLLILIGIVGFVMQYLLTSGVQREKKTSRAVAMTYSQLIYASIFDFLFFHHFPQGLELVGECIVIFSVLSIVYFKSDISGDEENTTILSPTRNQQFSARGGFKDDADDEEDEFNIDLEDFSEPSTPLRGN